MSKTIYWKDRKGQQIDVDLMDINYLRNTLKMIITGKTKSGSNFDVTKHIRIRPIKKSNFELKGDMAQEFNNGHLDDEYHINLGSRFDDDVSRGNQWDI